ncbi:hypothetical protein AB0M43_01285 [Longispora sp. NPDC051575]|uniref:hypothetical protein n=1 Tax=Longispora sp. NPDC051575 TaxID=3154943 RepID=UPI00343841B1
MTITLADLARQVVATTDPDQLELLEAVTAQWNAGAPRPRRWGWLAGTVDSDIEPTVTGGIIYPLLTSTFAQILGTAALVAWTRRRWWRRRKDVAIPQVQITLDAHQLEIFRVTCVLHGTALGLTTAQATALADAAHGALHRAMLAPRSGS